MSKTTITAKMRSDGKIVRRGDGATRVVVTRPMRAMSAAQIHAAAMADPDARPISSGQLRTARRVPRVKTMRRALGMTQEDFAMRYHIPLGTLRDWEQGRSQPDQPARAYLKAIAGDPAAVHRALERGGEAGR